VLLNGLLKKGCPAPFQRRIAKGVSFAHYQIMRARQFIDLVRHPGANTVFNSL
jgi:hypothetical protein